MYSRESCPICGFDKLWVVSDDPRGEWERIEYHCHECGNYVSRLITFKCQSSMTESDEWDMSEKEIERLQDEYEDKKEKAGVNELCLVNLK